MGAITGTPLHPPPPPWIINAQTMEPAGVTSIGGVFYIYNYRGVYEGTLTQLKGPEGSRYSINTAIC